MQSNGKLNILALLWLVLGLLTTGVMLQAFTAIAQNQVLAAKAAQRQNAELSARMTDCMLASPWELRQSCKSLGRVPMASNGLQTASLK